MTREQEKIAKLRKVLENIKYVLDGELTEEALYNLRLYVDRKVKAFDDYERSPPCP